MKTILIADDEEHLRRIYSLALSTKGYRVIEADSGEAGLALARQHLPDLILSDINMPGGDGSSFLRELRRDPELKGKQIVLMTGRPDLVTPRKGMEEGADDFLVKPVDLPALLSCVEARFNRISVSWRVEDQMLAQMRTLVPPQLPHEVFTPLAGIVGLAEILRSDFSTDLPAEVTEIHHDIYQSALRLHRTLRNYLLILDLQGRASSPAPSPPPLSPEAVEKSVRQGVKEAVHRHPRHEDVTVDVQAASLSIKAEDLTRMVEELVDNACKFSRHGTPVTVQLTAEGRLIISDQGRGMAPEEISRIGIFQQFERNKYEQQGLGLGLVLVQKLAALYGATFKLSSRPGEGSQAEITFRRPESQSGG